LIVELFGQVSRQTDPHNVFGGHVQKLIDFLTVLPKEVDDGATLKAALKR